MTKSVKNYFDPIFDEIVRQHSELKFIDESHDKKLALIITFIAVFLGLMFNQYIFGLSQNNFVSERLFYAILLIMMSSSISAFIGYRNRDWVLGVKISKLINTYKNNPSKDFKQVIGKYIQDSNSTNLKSVNEKSRFVKLSYGLMLLGFILLISLIFYSL